MKRTGELITEEVGQEPKRVCLETVFKHFFEPDSSGELDLSRAHDLLKVPGIADFDWCGMLEPEDLDKFVAARPETVAALQAVEEQQKRYEQLVELDRQVLAAHDGLVVPLVVADKGQIQQHVQLLFNRPVPRVRLVSVTGSAPRANARLTVKREGSCAAWTAQFSTEFSNESVRLDIEHMRKQAPRYAMLRKALGVKVAGWRSTKAEPVYHKQRLVGVVREGRMYHVAGRTDQDHDRDPCTLWASFWHHDPDCGPGWQVQVDFSEMYQISCLTESELLLPPLQRLVEGYFVEETLGVETVSANDGAPA
jgi:hypothetical protein